MRHGHGCGNAGSLPGFWTRSKSGKSKIDTARLVSEALREAKDDLTVKQDHIEKTYQEWREKSAPQFTTSNPESAINRGNAKLDRLDDEKHAIQDELRELQLQEEIIKLRRKHLEQRYGDVNIRRDEQISKLRTMTRDAATDRHFRSELARNKSLLDSVVKRLLEVDIQSIYGGLSQ